MSRHDVDERELLQNLLQRGYRYALSLTHNNEKAEDLLQDAWLSVLSKGGPRHVGYLFATIRNRFIDLDRRAAVLLVEPLEEGDLAGMEPQAALEAEEVRVELLALESALGTLRPEEREVLFLTAVEGFTAREVSQLTRRPRGTILSLAYRARIKLREFMTRAESERRR